MLILKELRRLMLQTNKDRNLYQVAHLRKLKTENIKIKSLTIVPMLTRNGFKKMIKTKRVQKILFKRQL